MQSSFLKFFDGYSLLYCDFRPTAGTFLGVATGRLVLFPRL